MRPLFKIPGRSSIDALTSWIGDGTIGVLLTSKQYEEGFYTKKEAAIIGTTFSVVSITFSIVIIEEVGLGAYFLPFYGTVVLTGLSLHLLCRGFILFQERKMNTLMVDHLQAMKKNYQKDTIPFHTDLKMH